MLRGAMSVTAALPAVPHAVARRARPVRSETMGRRRFSPPPTPAGGQGEGVDVEHGRSRATLLRLAGAGARSAFVAERVRASRELFPRRPPRVRGV